MDPVVIAAVEEHCDGGKTRHEQAFTVLHLAPEGGGCYVPCAMSDETTARKDAHLDLCATGSVEPEQNRTLLECVQLVHSALPELSVDDVRLETTLFGKKLRVPLMIT